MLVWVLNMSLNGISIFGMLGMFEIRVIRQKEQFTLFFEKKMEAGWSLIFRLCFFILGIFLEIFHLALKVMILSCKIMKT